MRIRMRDTLFIMITRLTEASLMLILSILLLSLLSTASADDVDRRAANSWVLAVGSYPDIVKRQGLVAAGSVNPIPQTTVNILPGAAATNGTPYDMSISFG